KQNRRVRVGRLKKTGQILGRLLVRQITGPTRPNATPTDKQFNTSDQQIRISSSSDQQINMSDQQITTSFSDFEEHLDETNSISLDSIIPTDKKTWEMLKFESSSDALGFY
ncbi:hypothetical protein LINPERPRIM_LOCUS36941, partial [Linum perenne]